MRLPAPKKAGSCLFFRRIATQKYLEAGKSSPRGIRGELKINPTCDSAEFARHRALYIDKLVLPVHAGAQKALLVKLEV